MLVDRFFEDKNAEIKYRDKVKGFLTTVHLGNYQKEDVESYYLRVTRITQGYRMEATRLKRALENWDNTPKATIVKMLSSKYNTKAELLKDLEETEKALNEWMELCEELDKIRTANRNFNKSLCFSNIRELIKDNPDVKIGQIEKEAGIRLGYMSRLEKGDNAAEPSVEFIVTAAKLLNVSVDTLISVDLANLTSTEKYLVSFIEKLKSDTIMEKINWNVETEFELDRQLVDCNGVSTHPLLSLETFYRQTECEYPEEVTDNVYVSKTFGPNTSIHGDCFNLRLKNGSTFYLMNIAKDVHYTNDKSAFVKEAVMYVPRGKTQVLATTQDEYPIGQLLEELYSTIKERMKHPQVNKDVMTAIDAFMKDDLEDDPEEPLPF